MTYHRCTWCKYLEDIGNTDLKEYLREYVESISPDMKTDKEEYQKRLEVCSKCSKCKEGICGYCGCFVIVRAVRKRMDCPNPGYSKWRLR